MTIRQLIETLKRVGSRRCVCVLNAGHAAELLWELGRNPAEHLKAGLIGSCFGIACYYAPGFGEIDDEGFTFFCHDGTSLAPRGWAFLDAEEWDLQRHRYQCA